MFVKELAVAFWGTETLGERSLTGKECPTTKTTRQPAEALYRSERIEAQPGSELGCRDCLSGGFWFRGRRDRVTERRQTSRSGI
ncbi:hypothetical protein JOQ06_025607 [Pogonophryne albipinna]|uniref:Uncharacterized protein n=1 Tax=Pogonophryne albipinna TaxID=1090488 RepID=A0AAD6FF25_9TELE|nr:hypothetical protein JOQ06_025607 [Pogonophryne albipinna]